MKKNNYNKEFIPFNNLLSQHRKLKKQIDKTFNDVINSNSFIRGRYVSLFEKKFSSMYDNFNCVSCANGTDAIYLALKSLKIGPGDEVLVPAISWISSSETITQSGAKVKFVDVNLNCLIDENEIEKNISSKTRAIIVVHLYGRPCNMTKIMKIANKFKLHVIEDCAQAHFAEWKGKKVGTFGSFGTFSFYPGKNIGAIGDAGCIITKSKKLSKIFRSYANHGSSKNKHDHIFEGVNSRMDGLQAGILLIKLKYINKWNNKRRKIATIYTKLLKNNPNIIAPNPENYEKSVFHLYVIRSRIRKKIIESFIKNNISFGIHYPKALINLSAYSYLKLNKKKFLNANRLEKEILSLPIYPELKYNQIKKVCDVINDI